MKTGVDLLRDAEAFLGKACGCQRERCEACTLRRTVTEYLDVVLCRGVVDERPQDRGGFE
jgi:hypothetical protein